jgi:hypothetical protein
MCLCHIAYKVLWPYRESLGIHGHLTNYTDTYLVDYDEVNDVRQELDHSNVSYWTDRVDASMDECADESERLWKKAKKSNWKKGVDDLDLSIQKCLREKLYYNKTSSEDYFFGDSFSRLASVFKWLVVDFEYAEEGKDVSVMWGYPENGIMAAIDYLVTDQRGYNQILKNISEPFREKIMINHTVRKVIWGEEGNVTVVTDGHGSFHAPKVISTCSLGVMKGAIDNDPKSKLRFIPPIPEDMQRGIRQVVMGHYAKIYAKFSYNFWGYNQILMLSRSETGLLPWAINLDHPVYFPGSFVLSFHVADAYADQFETQSHNETGRLIVEALEALLGIAVPDPLNILVSSFINDPYFNGSYSDVPVGVTEEDYYAMTKTLDDRVYFAGEHLDDVYYGYVHGAILNGEKIAKQVIDGRWAKKNIYTPLVITLLVLCILMSLLASIDIARWLMTKYKESKGSSSSSSSSSAASDVDSDRKSIDKIRSDERSKQKHKTTPFGKVDEESRSLSARVII